MSSLPNASHNSKPPFEIPPNNPTQPRWLLDLDDWVVRAYSRIRFHQDPNNREYGYGIISYTWGKYWNRTDTVPEKDAPDGIDWKIPRLAEGAISLGEARKVITSMDKRYVWWDWMCVPQGGCHKDIAEQEIGKQMEIYKNAKASIIWLHDTNWAQSSDVGHFLRNHYPERPLRQWLQNFSTSLQRIRESEPWLTSIWTLQEGVLLNHSRLVDRHGARLPDVPNDKRFHSDEATVVDLAIVPAKLARDIAMALFTGEGNPDPLFRDFTSVRENRIYAQQILSEIIRSGLFGYYDGPVPLTILAGKGSRRYDKATNPDQYWALIGALDLDVAPNYDLTIPKARENFFKALLKKYQWNLLLAPSLPLDISRLSWPEVIADGHILPLDDLFFISELVDGLPHLSWTGTETGGPIIIGGAGGAPFKVFRLKKTGRFRRYIQAQNSQGQDLVDVLGPDTEAPVEDATYLYIAKLQPKSGLPGKRCIEMRGYQRVGAGQFNGVVDLWVAEDDVALESISRISLYLPQKSL
ncbi:hypothetical protein BDV33DRAFT_231481 [Aspergillus novoparasiticus]|uniref:Heterokaryon incompatibility domain-containing protein n=1 Tax=Aspergillus novoparasiticus TaxID=986946 RepID=A0A5N6EP87_9EURO|nr:hypothetical protein BDV33DRAFT_231481 [Aspergillus novoparasiticus]